MGNASAIGTGAIALNGGTIDNTSGSALTLANNNAVTIGGSFAFTGSNNLNFGTGAVSNAAASSTITLNGSTKTLTFGGIMTIRPTQFKQQQSTVQVTRLFLEDMH
jgi:hypothetical protein